jgi:hypothetical protein
MQNNLSAGNTDTKNEKGPRRALLKYRQKGIDLSLHRLSSFLVLSNLVKVQVLVNLAAIRVDDAHVSQVFSLRWNAPELRANRRQLS